eukprot:TRINITY_DN20454_c0_g1_i3.p1 TRINITY_DN20454_c0_g1~~TRINITY_DN20454_c0_g1_i3.p1  ORF type:complete len:1140 (-),score=262.48 TRINITY_DN20454_c0_g1_i3:349-3768(-)
MHGGQSWQETRSHHARQLFCDGEVRRIVAVLNDLGILRTSGPSSLGSGKELVETGVSDCLEVITETLPEKFAELLHSPANLGKPPCEADLEELDHCHQVLVAEVRTRCEMPHVKEDERRRVCRGTIEVVIGALQEGLTVQFFCSRLLLDSPVEGAGGSQGSRGQPAEALVVEVLLGCVIDMLLEESSRKAFAKEVSQALPFGHELLPRAAARERFVERLLTSGQRKGNHNIHGSLYEAVSSSFHECREALDVGATLPVLPRFLLPALEDSEEDGISDDEDVHECEAAALKMRYEGRPFALHLRRLYMDGLLNQHVEEPLLASISKAARSRVLGNCADLLMHLLPGIAEIEEHIRPWKNAFDLSVPDKAVVNRVQQSLTVGSAVDAEVSTPTGRSRIQQLLSSPLLSPVGARIGRDLTSPRSRTLNNGSNQTRARAATSPAHFPDALLLSQAIRSPSSRTETVDDTATADLQSEATRLRAQLSDLEGDCERVAKRLEKRAERLQDALQEMMLRGRGSEAAHLWPLVATPEDDNCSEVATTFLDMQSRAGEASSLSSASPRGLSKTPGGDANGAPDSPMSPPPEGRNGGDATLNGTRSVSVGFHLPQDSLRCVMMELSAMDGALLQVELLKVQIKDTERSREDLTRELARRGEVLQAALVEVRSQGRGSDGGQRGQASTKKKKEPDVWGKLATCAESLGKRYPEVQRLHAELKDRQRDRDDLSRRLEKRGEALQSALDSLHLAGRGAEAQRLWPLSQSMKEEISSVREASGRSPLFLPDSPSAEDVMTALRDLVSERAAQIEELQRLLRCRGDALQQALAELRHQGRGGTKATYSRSVGRLTSTNSTQNNSSGGGGGQVGRLLSNSSTVSAGGTVSAQTSLRRASYFAGMGKEGHDSTSSISAASPASPMSSKPSLQEMCVCGADWLADSVFCRKCGRRREEACTSKRSEVPQLLLSRSPSTGSNVATSVTVRQRSLSPRREGPKLGALGLPGSIGGHSAPKRSPSPARHGSTQNGSREAGGHSWAAAQACAKASEAAARADPTARSEGNDQASVFWPNSRQQLRTATSAATTAAAAAGAGQAAPAQGLANSKASSKDSHGEAVSSSPSAPACPPPTNSPHRRRLIPRSSGSGSTKSVSSG